MTKPKYRRLTCDDRRVIENMSKAKNTQSDIAKAIGVSQSTISRELSRNSADGIYKHIDAFAHMYFVNYSSPSIVVGGQKLKYWNSISQKEMVA